MKRKPLKSKQEFDKITNGKSEWTGEEIIELLEIHKHDADDSGIKAAKYLGISPSYFYQAMQGKRNVGPKFCRALGITRQWKYERN